MTYREHFSTLDEQRWTTSYLPAWSSRQRAAARVQTGPNGLDLSIPTDHPLWCPDTHPSPLRVSAIHSANRSGPVGSTDAPQPFRDGQLVVEEQPLMLGYTPHYGRISVTCSAQISARSMFSAWMVGLEDEPHRSGEICLVEVFGDRIRGRTAEVGQGIHRFRDPHLEEDFTATRMPIDVTMPHVYSVDWAPDLVTFRIDDAVTREIHQAPDYPMMLILGVFDFPDRAGDPHHVPRLRVHDVTGGPPTPGLS